MKVGEILKAARERLKIEALNAMQQAVWQSRAERMVVLSPTGSGKTVAFAGAMLQRLSGGEHRLPAALVLAPSRELVIQIGEVLRSLARGLKVATFYGRHAMADEVNTLTGHPDIIVATPGRLLDHLTRKSVDLSALEALVIDEYDKSLELGFYDEMSRICRRLPRKLRLVVLTSATAIDQMPDFLDLSAAHTIDFTNSGKPTARLDVARVVSYERDKLPVLRALLASVGEGRSMVFVNHRESAERVHQFLVSEGFATCLYHGGLEQQDRDRAVITLNNGTTPVMVATDLAARGLDIEAVENVIHYHLPPTPQALTHRNGRTARVDRSGRVYFIIAEGENVPEYVDWDHDFHPDHDAPLPAQPQMVTYYANAGRKEKVSRGDLVGLLCKTLGLQAAQIGRIDVRDHSAYVAIAAAAAPLIPATTQKIKSARLRLTPLK